MTHTLETTGIARVVARALRLNEDLDGGDRARARHGPPAVRPRRRGGARRGCADGGFRHNEQSARIARRLNLTHEVVDGILTHTGRAASRRRSRGRSCASSTASPTSTTTSTTRSATGSSRRATCRATRSRCSGRPARSGSTRSSTTWSSTRRAAGDIVQGDEIGAAMLSLRAFMFEHVYLGPETRPEHARARDDDRPDLRAPRGRGATRRTRSSSSSPA